MVPRFLGLMGLLGVLGQKGKLFLIMIGNIFLVCFSFCPNTPNTLRSKKILLRLEKAMGSRNIH